MLDAAEIENLAPTFAELNIKTAKKKPPTNPQPYRKRGCTEGRQSE